MLLAQGTDLDENLTSCSLKCQCQPSTEGKGVPAPTNPPAEDHRCVSSGWVCKGSLMKQFPYEGPQTEPSLKMIHDKFKLIHDLYWNFQLCFQVTVYSSFSHVSSATDMLQHWL